MKVFKKVVILGLALTAIGSTAAFGCDQDQQFTTGGADQGKVVASQSGSQSAPAAPTAGSGDTSTQH
jgi:hypothetical protein